MLDDKLHVDLGASYVIQAEQNMISGGRYFNPLFPLYLFPRGEDFENVKIFERYNEERRFPTGNMAIRDFPLKILIGLSTAKCFPPRKAVTCFMPEYNMTYSTG